MTDSDPITIVPHPSPSGARRRRVWFIVPLIALLVGSLVFAGLRTPDLVTPTAPRSLDAGKTGMYVGFNEEARFRSMEEALGQQLAWTLIFLGSKSVDQIRGASFGQLESDDAYLPDLSHRVNLVVTTPLAFGPGGEAKTDAGRARVKQNLIDTANGTWDDDYRVVAKRLADAGFGDAVIRLGHEFDGDWSPHSARGHNDQYIAAFRHVHDVFESVSPDFRFDWTSMRAHFRNYGPDAYPGDDYVDIIGMDIYYRTDGQISDRVWDNQYLPALEAHREFARSHGKPVSYPEWGRAFGTSTRYIGLMYDWFASIDTGGPGSLAYQSYFNENDADYDLDRNPEVKSDYLSVFGSPDGAVGPDTGKTIDAIRGPAVADARPRRGESSKISSDDD